MIGHGDIHFEIKGIPDTSPPFKFHLLVLMYLHFEPDLDLVVSSLSGFLISFDAYEIFNDTSIALNLHFFFNYS
jgi:hypothetical protein